MKHQSVNLRNYPLLYPTLGLFLSSAILYVRSWQFDVVWPVTTALLCLLTLIYFLFSQVIRQSWQRRAFVFVLFFAIGAFYFSLNDHRGQGVAASKVQTNATLIGRVREVKKWEETRGSYVLDLQHIRFRDSLLPAAGKLLVFEYFSEKQKTVIPDQLVALSGELKPIQNKNNPGEFDAVYYYGSKGFVGSVFLRTDQRMILGWDHTLGGLFERWRNYLAKMMEQQLDGVFLGVAKALILGDKSDLDTDTVRVFSNTGSMHVLAVSGMHIGMFLILFNAFFRQFPKVFSKRSALLWSVALIWIYGGVSGASPSVMRAVIMFSILAMGQLYQRQNSAVNSLFLSAILLFFLDPFVLYDIGFQLTYAAMFGIFFLYPAIHNLLSVSNKWLEMVWEGTAVGLAATITTMPLTLFWFYQFPNYFALANLGVMLFGFFVLVAGIIFLFTAWIPFLNGIVAFVFSLSIVALVYWVTWVDSIPGAVSGGFHVKLWQLMAMILFLSAIFWSLSRKKHVFLTSSLFVAVLVVVSFERLIYFREKELIVPVAKHLQLIYRSGPTALVLYEPERPDMLTVPREIQDYVRFAGIQTEIVPVIKAHQIVRWGGQKIQIDRASEGWNIAFSGQKYFYRTRGVASPSEVQGWQTSSIQRLVHPEKSLRPIQLSLN